MTEEACGGWKNYETWCVNFWLINEEGSYLELREAARRAAREGADRDDAEMAFAKWLKEKVVDGSPLSGEDSLYGDLLDGVFYDVDWDELAASQVGKVWDDENEGAPEEAEDVA